MQKVLITGANGFVGNYLTRLLLGKSYKVMATGTGASRLPFSEPHFSYASLDVTDAAAVKEVVEHFQPEILVHCAAMTKPDDCELNQDAAWKVNIGGTQNMLQAAATVGAYFLHLSTDFVFAGTKDVYHEDDEGDPVNFYGRTKWEAELLVRQYPHKWAIVRPILIYGAPLAGRQNLLTVVAQALKEGKPLKLFTDQRRLPTYVGDLAWALGEMIHKKSTGIYNVCGRDALSPYDIGLAVAKYFSLDASLITPVTAEAFHQPAKRPPQTIFDLAKVKRELGYKPTSFEAGLKRTFCELRYQ